MNTTHAATLLQEYLDLATAQRENAQRLEGDAAKLEAAKWDRTIARIQVGLEATPRETFQEQVRPWLHACFGEEVANDTRERNHRYLEESLELVQSCGATEAEAHELVRYVFSRPAGDAEKEAGGVMLTLAALCLAHGIDMDGAGAMELASVWMRVGAIRAKWMTKPKDSPLPSEPVASTSGTGHLCSVGPAADQMQRYLLRFEDADRGEALHYDQAEAYRAFGQAEAMGWNCHLFQLAPRKPELAALSEQSIVTRALLEALPEFDADASAQARAEGLQAWAQRVVLSAQPHTVGMPARVDLKSAAKLMEALENGAVGYQQDQQKHTERRLNEARQALFQYLKTFA